MPADRPNLDRYDRQMRCRHLTRDGQHELRRRKALIIGVGGLGAWAAELLARAGVGALRLVDDDIVELVNIHRQALYDANDVGRRKVDAAADRLRRINSDVAIETAPARMSAENIADLADGADVIIDGCDNFASRFVINDFAVRNALPWVFAGVVTAQAQTMTIIPSRTACLRCIYENPPPDEITCLQVGVLGPAVAAISAIQTTEAIKILAGHPDAASPYLLKMDLWTNTIQRIDTLSAAAETNCPCCKQRKFEFLQPSEES